MIEFYMYICAWPFVLLDCSLVLCGFSLEEGRMPLHDAVGVNLKKGTTTENQGAGA